MTHHWKWSRTWICWCDQNDIMSLEIYNPWIFISLNRINVVYASFKNERKNIHIIRNVQFKTETRRIRIINEVAHAWAFFHRTKRGKKEQLSMSSEEHTNNILYISSFSFLLYSIWNRKPPCQHLWTATF